MSLSLNQAVLKFRNRMPRSVRAVPRGLKFLATKRKPFQMVDEELIEGCQLVHSRERLLEKLPKQSICCELGTYKGDFAKEIIERVFPAKLHLVDMDLSILNDRVRNHPAVETHLGYTHDVIKAFDDDYFDWIYIDADHSYQGVLKDARAAAAKVKPGGLMIFNDFAHMDPYLGVYGVQQAAVEFANEARWSFAWFAFEAHGLYDLAMQKPAETDL